MKNLGANDELVCKVAEIFAGQHGVPEVGVEFLEACPRFWRVSFPPTN